MKKLNVLFFSLLGLLMFSQLPTTVKFDKNFVESENHWVIIPPKNADDKTFYLGYIYFDNSGGGYSIQQINKFTLENGLYKKEVGGENAIIIQRLDGDTVNFAFVPEEGLKQMNLEKFPSVMKYYDLQYDGDDKKQKKASALNGMDRPDLALPILLSLKQKNISNANLFFELAYAYNAMGRFNDAELIINEGEKKGLMDELILKEKLFALSHNNKLADAEKVLKENFSVFKNSIYKEEAIGNMVGNFSRLQNKKGVEKWVDIYFNEFPNNGRYWSQIEKMKQEAQTWK